MRTTRREFVSLVGGSIIAAGIEIPAEAFFKTAFAADQKVLLKSAKGGKLYRVYPAASLQEKDSVLFLELNGAPYRRGLQHGLLLAAQIADEIDNRYACDVFTPEALAWVERAYGKMPREWQDEIRGIADGLSQAGYTFPFAEVVMHTTQLPVYGTQFPWFLCAWEEPANPTGSFSYAVWGKYTLGGGTIALNSPDWGAVPYSLARNRVIVSVRPNIGNRLVFSGVAGVIGMPGFNETGLSIAGTAGPVSAGGSVMPSFDNGRPIPDGFMTLFMIGRHTLQHVSAQDPQWAERVEELFVRNPVDNFHLQVTVRGRSIVWESGGANSPDYPRIARREAGEWDNGSIMPVDWRGEFVLTQTGILRMDSLPPVEVKTNYADGSAYNGIVLVGDRWVEWRRWLLGRAFARVVDPNRDKLFENWFANLGTALVPAPAVITGDGAQPMAVVSVSQDGSGGYWILNDGSDHGSWVASGNIFRALDSKGAQMGSGRLYDFGNGVTGWYRLGDNDIEFVAWKFNFPSGANERLDAMNLSTLPAIRPWVDVIANGLDRIVPPARTHLLMKYLGEPAQNIGLDEIYRIFQQAYLAGSDVNQPFGVGVYDLQNLNAMFTVSRYDGKEYVGGLNPAQKPISLNRYQLFGR
jgi:hypothetical protein